MVLSSILPVKLGATSRKSRRSLPWVSSSTSLREPQSSSDGLGNLDDCYIRDASTLGDVSGIFDDGDPALQSLNGCLEVLAGIFPDVQLEVFREMLGSFGEESRLAVVTEALLKNKAKFVGGRWRVRRTVHKEVETAAEGDGGREDVKVPVEERFRGDGYRKTVQKVLCREFRGLSRSTVDAVLAEHNYSYTLARPTLLSLSSRSWRSSVSSFFLRRKNSSLSAPDKHPLVVMRPLDGSEDAPILPMLRSTGSKELDRELFDTLIRPLQRQHRLDQESRDRELAEAINAAEAEDAGAFYDCEHEIGPEGYRHFCEHFRPRGQGACEECDKCDLYRSEDEEGVLRKASEAAEKEWRAREEASTSTSVSALEAWRWENRDDFAGPRAPRTSRRASWTLPSWEQIIDWVVERLVELH
ncbi:MAG: hypothetical protein M1832_002168 [Thelocarpon impressellum]|nr:MAG: hypothetical protein M1832_002168 [Thelocarpon impressellum]